MNTTRPSIADKRRTSQRVCSQLDFGLRIDFAWKVRVKDRSGPVHVRQISIHHGPPETAE
jgi:hypothetical protein